MRLIEARSGFMYEFSDDSLPEYAILSHTRNPGHEVTFQQ